MSSSQRAVGPDGVSLKVADALAVLASALGIAVLAGNAARVAWWPSAGWFALVLASPVVLRTLQARHPGHRWLKFLADFSPTCFFFAWYLSLNPILDAANQPLADDWLIALDQQLFGLQPALAAEHVVPPLLNDMALLAYCTHFGWSLLLGLALWFDGREEVFDRFVTALVVFLIVNFVLYAAVPAMGPRYFQAARFDGPIPGAIAPRIDELFRGSPLARDCFPSGHTGLSLVVLITAFRHARRFFWGALPILTLLVIGTIVGRFHYGVDLLAAVPLAIASIVAGERLQRRAPAGLRLLPPALLQQARRLASVRER